MPLHPGFLRTGASESLRRSGTAKDVPRREAWPGQDPGKGRGRRDHLPDGEPAQPAHPGTDGPRRDAHRESPEADSQRYR